MVSPKTLKTRPKVSFTYWITEIGRTCTNTSIPRVKPSVDSMAIVRTIPSPNPRLLQGRFLFFFRHFVDDKCIVNLRKFFPCCKQDVYNGTDNPEQFYLNSSPSPILYKILSVLAQLGPNTLRKSLQNHVSVALPYSKYSLRLAS